MQHGYRSRNLSGGYATYEAFSAVGLAGHTPKESQTPQQASRRRDTAPHRAHDPKVRTLDSEH